MTHSMDDKNVPTAVLELAGASGTLGTWVASGWSGDETMAAAVRKSYLRQVGAPMADTIAARLGEPQFVEAGGRRYSFTLRPTRAYKPFSLTLLKATHTIYPGTENLAAANPGIPKDYRSRVRINNPEKRENREVEIYMNSPLRYGGLTFYQYQMPPEAALRAGETPWSTLQVVRNPAWLTPYAGCAIVATGLVFQFMIHLVGFVSRRKTA